MLILSRIISDTTNMIQEHIIPGKVSRAPRLASLEVQCDAASGDSSCEQSTVQALVEHFNANSAQGFIVDDVSRHIDKLDTAAYKHFRAQIEQPVRAVADDTPIQDSVSIQIDRSVAYNCANTNVRHN